MMWYIAAFLAMSKFISNSYSSCETHSCQLKWPLTIEVHCIDGNAAGYDTIDPVESTAHFGFKSPS